MNLVSFDLIDLPTTHGQIVVKELLSSTYSTFQYWVEQYKKPYSMNSMHLDFANLEKITHILELILCHFPNSQEEVFFKTNVDTLRFNVKKFSFMDEIWNKITLQEDLQKLTAKLAEPEIVKYAVGDGAGDAAGDDVIANASTIMVLRYN